MSKVLQVLASQTTLGTASPGSTINGAKRLWVYNNQASATLLTVQDTNNAAVGSITIAPNSGIVLAKRTDEKIFAAAAIVATPIAISN